MPVLKILLSFLSFFAGGTWVCEPQILIAMGRQRAEGQSLLVDFLDLEALFIVSYSGVPRI